jgi:nucleotide-binding universal stress UspA family protein
MKKILIALDYGPTAQKVAEKGFELAKNIGAQVILVHAISDPMFYTSTAYSPIMGFDGYLDIGTLQPEIMDEIQKTSAVFLTKTREHLGDSNIETVVVEGDAAAAILEIATDKKIDIIVIGSHSQKWLEAVVMGSVTEQVLRHTSLPLFIVPTKEMAGISE